MKKKVIITGGSGLLGANLAWKMRDQWDIDLTYCRSPILIEKTHSHALDLGDIERTDQLFRKAKPDLVIHTAGLTDVEKCEKHKFEAFYANVLSSHNLAKIAKKYTCQLVHISTDHFSKSSRAMSDEESIEIPLNNYARTKLEAEYEVQKMHPNALIMRTNFFGQGHQKRKSFSDFIIENTRSEKPITLFHDSFFTPILIDDLLECLILLINKNIRGIVNVVGDDRLSKYDFGMKIARIFDLDRNFIKSGSIKDRKDLEIRPGDMSLSNQKLKTLIGNKELSIESGIKKLKNQEKRSFSFVNRPGRYPTIFYGKQSIGDSDILKVIGTLNSPFLTQGPQAQEFEEKIADYVGAKYAVSLCNWTSGLQLACLAAGVTPRDSVLTSPLSFVASSNCALHVGATPAFADINLETLNIDPQNVEKKCRELGNVKAIIPVHFAGHPCDMKKLKEIADLYGAVIIEDAAHALGSQLPSGESIGSCNYSLMSGFSFHPVKNITTGEGSVITTNNEEIYKQLIRLRNHGITKDPDCFKNTSEAFTSHKVNPWYYEMQRPGFNYRLTDIQCSLGLSQIKRIDDFIQRRREISQKYDKAFNHLKYLKIMQSKTRSLSANHLYVVMVNYQGLQKNRVEVFECLKQYGIMAHVHYIPIPLQPFYLENIPVSKEDYQNALTYYRSAITLPLYPSLSDREVDRIIHGVLKIFDTRKNL